MNGRKSFPEVMEAYSATKGIDERDELSGRHGRGCPQYP